MIIDIKTCARCGGDHDHLEFSPLTNPPITEWPDALSHWWATCPTSSEPISMTVMATATDDEGIADELPPPPPDTDEIDKSGSPTYKWGDGCGGSIDRG